MLNENTAFGMGAKFKQPMDDAILERKEFDEIPFVRRLKDVAYKQIGKFGRRQSFRGVWHCRNNGPG